VASPFVLLVLVVAAWLFWRLFLFAKTRSAPPRPAELSQSPPRAKTDEISLASQTGNASSKATTGVSFNLVNPKAVEWAKQHAAETLTGLSNETKAAIRSLVVRAFTEGIPSRALAKEIRPLLAHTEEERKLIALHHKEMQAKRYKGLRLEKSVATYAEKILATRASSIAVTQVMLASNQGQLELWRQAKEHGWLRGTEKREWIGTRDAKSCIACRALDGKKAHLNEPFQTPFGPIMGPPLHDECRCSMGLVE
jgi:hypothetical protein